MATRQVKLTATLKDAGGTALSGKTITFSYRTSGTTTWTTAGTANTDTNGVATYTVSLNAPGTYDFQASFAGDAQYEPSSNTVTNFAVKAGTTLTLTAQAL